jgi:type VI secretion system protein ImpA
MLEIETASKGRPEQVSGTNVIPAVDPDWKAVLSGSEAMLAKTRDLRIIWYWTLAKTKTTGFPGARDGLTLIKGCLEQFWETVWPRLDAEDNNDPTERVNAVNSMTGDTFLRFLRECPLAGSRQFGRINFRDVLMAKGEIAPPAGGKPTDPNLIEAVFGDCDIESLKNVDKAITELIAAAKGIDTFLTQKVGAAKAPQLGELHKLLAEIHKPVQAGLAKRGEAAGGAPADAAAGGAPPAGAPGQAGGSAPAQAARLSGEISSTEDVVQAFSKILRYYERHEMSSPVPVLVRCAQRFVNKGFPEIAKVMTPEVVKVIDALSGGAAAAEKK